MKDIKNISAKKKEKLRRGEISMPERYGAENIETSCNPTNIINKTGIVLFSSF